MAPWNRRFLLDTISFRFHVKLGECIGFYTSKRWLALGFLVAINSIWIYWGINSGPTGDQTILKGMENYERISPEILCMKFGLVLKKKDPWKVSEYAPSGRWEWGIFTNLGGVSNIFYFHPYLGKWSNLTNIFQRGWNHQLVTLHKKIKTWTSPRNVGSNGFFHPRKSCGMRKIHGFWNNPEMYFRCWTQSHGGLVQMIFPFNYLRFLDEPMLIFRGGFDKHESWKKKTRHGEKNKDSLLKTQFLMEL